MSDSSYSRSVGRNARIWVRVIHIAVHALCSLSLPALSTSPASPSDPTRPPPRSGRLRRCSRSCIWLQWCAHPRTSSPPSGPGNWRRCWKLVARHIVLQHFCALSFEGGSPGSWVPLVGLQPLEDLSCRRGELREGRARGSRRGGDGALRSPWRRRYGCFWCALRRGCGGGDDRVGWRSAHERTWAIGRRRIDACGIRWVHVIERVFATIVA